MIRLGEIVLLPTLGRTQRATSQPSRNRLGRVTPMSLDDLRLASDYLEELARIGN